VALAEGSSGSVALLSPLALGGVGVGLAALVLQPYLLDGRRSLGAARGQESLVAGARVPCPERERGPRRRPQQLWGVVGVRLRHERVAALERC
jgi:hypothetical protein